MKLDLINVGRRNSLKFFSVIKAAVKKRIKEGKVLKIGKKDIPTNINSTWNNGKPVAYLGKDLVVFISRRGKGIWTFKPYGIEFTGGKNSLITGCAVARIKIVYDNGFPDKIKVFAKDINGRDINIISLTVGWLNIDYSPDDILNAKSYVSSKVSSGLCSCC